MMDLYGLIEKVNESYGLMRFKSDGTIVCSDKALKEEVEMLVPLDIIKDGWAAVIGYLCNVKEENVQKEKETIWSLILGMYGKKIKESIFFNADGSVLCTDCELVRGLVKKVPRNILAGGYDEIAIYLHKKSAMQTQLHRFLTHERGATAMEAAG